MIALFQEQFRNSFTYAEAEGYKLIYIPLIKRYVPRFSYIKKQRIVALDRYNEILVSNFKDSCSAYYVF